MEQFNILYLHSHDTGRYIQPYGHAVPTPHLQQLAEEGILFRKNFCVTPTCSPSRAALLTGCYPHENGMLGLAHRGWFLNNYGLHIIHTLHQAGYASALAGVQHVVNTKTHKEPWKVIGYHRKLEGEEYKAAVSFLKSPPLEPFFLSVGFVETHREFPSITDTPDDPCYCLPPAPLPDSPETREDMARFKACARLLDRKIGAVLNALEMSGLAERTLVICTTDHGIAFPRMKCNLQDSGLETMLIMRGPGGFTGGAAIDGMTTHLDIFPTICHLLEVSPPPWLRGKSLLSLVRGEVDEIHNELFFETNYHAAYEPMRAVRTRRMKYIRRYALEEEDTPILSNVDDGASKSVWLDHDWQGQSLPEESLFDLVFDPHESNNLVGNSTNQTILMEMRNRLKRWMRETKDPLLKGPIPEPPNAVVTDRNALSPHHTPEYVKSIRKKR